jgi:hypothetical protein
LLRYHRDIDQSDFSRDQTVLKKLRRYEDFKYQYELEELQRQVEQMGGKKDSVVPVPQQQGEFVTL